jgi:hypothetical protein
MERNVPNASCQLCDYEGFSSGALYTHIRRTHHLSVTEYEELVKGAQTLMAMKQENGIEYARGLVFVRPPQRSFY